MWMSIVNVMKVLASPSTVLQLLRDVVELLQLVKDHPEYGEDAAALLSSLTAFIGPAK